MIFEGRTDRVPSSFASYFKTITPDILDKKGWFQPKFRQHDFSNERNLVSAFSTTDTISFQVTLGTLLEGHDDQRGTYKMVFPAQSLTDYAFIKRRLRTSALSFCWWIMPKDKTGVAHIFSIFISKDKQITMWHKEEKLYFEIKTPRYVVWLLFYLCCLFVVLGGRGSFSKV